MTNNMMHDIRLLPISQITIGKRHRKDLGDLAALAASIESGLLQPIGVTPEMDLIWGYRRLLATRDILKRQEIPCRIVSVVSIAQGEFDENMMRKDFAPSEQVAIIDTLRGYAHGGDRKSDQGRNCDLDRLTTKEAAGRVGFCLDNGLHDRSTMRLALAPHHTIPPRRPLPSVVSRSIAAMPSLISPGPGPRSRESGSTTVRDTGTAGVPAAVR